MNTDLCSCFSDLIYTKDRKVFIYLIILGKALLGLHQPWVMWCSGIKLSIQIYQKKKKYTTGQVHKTFCQTTSITHLIPTQFHIKGYQKHPALPPSPITCWPIPGGGRQSL